MTEYPLRHGKDEWTLEADPASWVAQRIEEAGRPYEYAMLEQIAKYQPTGTAVDVGAHIGNHTLFFAVACHMHVHAFEPIFGDPLRDNITDNGLEDEVDIHEVALGAESTFARDSGERILSRPGRDRYDGRVGEGRLEVGRGPIVVRPLDDFGIEDVSVLKVDVEGMEPDVLRGAERTIREYEPWLFLETPERSAERAVGEVIEPWGYQLVGRFQGLTPRSEWRLKSR